MKSVIALGLVRFLSVVSASPVELVQRQSSSNTATVNLAVNNGASKHLASGLIYGIPDTPNQIPSSFYTGIGFNYGRAGGAQTPSTGWGGGGVAQYRPRFQSALSNYKTTRQYGGRFQLLLHDLWGADSTESSSFPFPGDNGDWSSYDAFLSQLISDINANSMTTGLDLEIWNEPDGYGFWHPSQAQYLQMWGRGYYRLRQAFGTKIPIVGPTLAGQPDPNNNWWTNYLQFIKGNGSVPDQYTWHVEGDPSNSFDDPAYNDVTLRSLLTRYNLPVKQFNVNEYGVPSEQQPAASAWFISRFERLNMIGLRGNWASAYALHDYLAALVGKPNGSDGNYNATGTGYWANGEWYLYNYYKTKMTGNRTGTVGSGDNLFDVYATSTGSATGVKMICGSRLQTGTWYITVTGLSSIGLPTSGSLNIQTYRFDNTQAAGGGPVSLGVVNHQYSNNQVTFFVAPATSQTAYAFEFV